MNADVMLTVGFGTTQISQGINQLQNQIRRGAQGLNSWVAPLGRITGKANEFQKSLDASSARVIAFGATAGVLHNLSSAFKSLLAASIDMEVSLTQINALLKVSSTDLAKFAGDLLRIANSTGQSFKDTASAATEFARQGLAVNQVLQRTEAAMTLTRLSGLALEDSVSSLTATMNSFHREALSAIEIVNRMANVDARFAVSAADLAEALKRVGGAAADAGVHFNDVIALVTAAQQATARGGSVIGNSFKTIFTRLQRPQVLDDLEAMGIAVRKSNGETRNLIDILRNLANTYDTLSSGQKSFVSETVGGIYQVNILKSVLNDLGNGFSTFDGAIKAANDSTAAAEERMKDLNDTIASRLNQTINNLQSSFASLSQITIAPTIKGGLGAFDNIIKAVSSVTAQNSNGVMADFFKGIAKGFGNLLSGPALQFVIFGFFKLFQKLNSFIIDSVKDLTGLNNAAREREAIEKRVVAELSREPDLIAQIREGTLSIEAVHRRILALINQEAAQMRDLAAVTPPIVDLQQHAGVRITNAPVSTHASGFIPNLEIAALEREEARRGGYTPGSVIYKSVQNGPVKKGVVVNDAETISNVEIGGKLFQWINPPADSPAGRRHRSNSLMRTGMDPYELGQKSLHARGFIPNLVNTGAAGDTIPASDILNNPALKDRLNKFHPGDGERFAQAWVSKTRNPYYTKGALVTTLRGVLKGSIFEDRYKNPRDPNGRLNNEAEVMVEVIASSLGKQSVQQKMKVEDFEMGDIKNMLKLRSKEFAVFSLFDDFNKKSAISGEGVGSGITDIRGDKIKVDYRTTGLKDPKKVFDAYVKSTGAGLNDFIKDTFGVEGVSNEEIATKLGIDYDTGFKAFLKSKGIPTATKRNENFDILGYDEGVFSAFHPLKGGVAGGEIKTSLTGDTPNSVADKVARALAFKRGTGNAPVPLFKQIAKFGKGPTGLIDLGFFEDRSEYERLSYAALSTAGKAFQVQVGARGAGKMDAALSGGAKPITSASDISKYSQFILNTDRREGLESGTLGLAMASASDVVGYRTPQSQLLANLSARMKNAPAGLQTSNAELKQLYDNLSSFPHLGNYDEVLEELEKRFKGTGRFRIAANGLIPNLMAALHRENMATGGNGIVGQSSKLKSSGNPLGLAAIDKRTQSTAEDAIMQHLAMGQSMTQIKSARSASGFIPNLATDPSNQIMMTAILASAQWVQEMGSVTEHFKNLKEVLKSVNNPFSTLANKQKEYIDSTSDLSRRQQDWIKTIDAARNKVAQGHPVEIGGSRIDNLNDFDDHFRSALSEVGQELDTFQQAVKNRKSNIRRIGFGVALGSGVAGGIASSLAAGTFKSPDAANAIDQLTGGVQLAGQALASFPNKFGKAVAIFSVLDSVGSAANSFSSGIEGSRKRLEDHQSKTQALVSTLDALTVSISSLNTMVLDSSVSLDAINREQRNYAEQLAQLRTNNPGIASQLDSAATPNRRIELLQQAKTEAGRDLDKEAGLFQIKALGAERSFGVKVPFAGNVRSSFGSGGIFGGESEEEQKVALRTLKSNAATLISEIPETLKKSLIGNLGNASEFTGALQGNDSASRIIDAIRESGGNENDVKAFVDSVRQMLNGEAINSNPRLTRVRDNALKQNSAAQLNTDAALRNEAALRRTFSNAGVVRSSNILDLSMAGMKAGFNARDLGVSRMRSQSSRIALLNGDETVGANELSADTARAQNEARMKLKSLADSTSRKLIENFAGLNVDEMGKATFNTGATAVASGQNLPRVSPEREELISAYNKGLSGVVQGGDLTRFIGQNGQFNFSNFEKEFTNKSGASGDILNQLQGVLAANRGNLDVMKIVQQNTSDQTDILQDSLKEQMEANQKFDELRKELDVKRMIQFLGGTKNLTSRESRREMERNLTKGGILMENGPTLESRGMGASMFLKALKDMGADLRIAGRDRNGNAIGIRGNGMSMRVAAAMNLEATAIREQQYNSVERVRNNLTNAGANQAMMMFGGAVLDPRMSNAASAAVANEHRVEGDTLINQALDAAGQNTLKMGKELDLTTSKLTNFGRGLDGLKRQLDDAVISAAKARDDQKKTQDKASADTQAAAAKAREETGGGEGPKLTKGFNFAGLVPKIGGIAGSLALGALFTSKQQRGQFFGNVKDNLGSLFTGAKNVAMIDVAKPFKKKSFSPSDEYLKGRKGLNKEFYEFGTGRMRVGPNDVVQPTKTSKSAMYQRDFEAARAEEGSRLRLQRRTQNRGLAQIEANKIKESMTFNPARQPNPNAYKMGFGANMNGMGGMLGGAIASQLSDSPLAYAGGMLATQALGPQFAALFGAGGAGAGLAAAPLAGALAVGATAYGGFKTGQYLGNKVGLGVGDKLNEDIYSGNTEAGRNAAVLVQKNLKAGKSTTDIRKLLDAQIQTTMEQIQTGGGGGFFSKLIGTDKATDDLSRAADEMKALRDSLDALKAVQDEKAKSEGAQDKLLAALEKIANGGGSGTPVSIKVELSVKDVDKLPDILQTKLIKPLEQQIKNLQSKVGNIENSVGITPSPASV
jgi:TP901 family phage tail tape measure protein